MNDHPVLAIISLLFVVGGGCWTAGVMWGRRDSVTRSELDEHKQDFQGLKNFIRGYNGMGGGLVDDIAQINKRFDDLEWEGTKYSRHRQDVMSNIIGALVVNSNLDPDEIARYRATIDGFLKDKEGARRR